MGAHETLLPITAPKVIGAMLTLASDCVTTVDAAHVSVPDPSVKVNVTVPL
jgi:hypothetical protein